MDPYTSFLSGILAAFTPCVVILIPALIYRFSNSGEKKPWLSIIKFAASFLVVYVISALFLAELFSSSLRYGLQLGLGLLFIVMGILALLKKFNPLQFQLIKSPYLFGLAFALIVSINPCVFAYLGLLFATTSSHLLVLSMVTFAIGLLLPALFFAIFGKTLLTKIKRANKVMHHVAQGMNILLVLIGIYMMYTVKHFGGSDVLVTGILLAVTFGIILRSFFIIQGVKSLKKLENIILFIALIIILFAVVFHCNAHIQTNTTQEEIDAENPFLINNNGQSLNAEHPTCSANVADCVVCKRCISVFAMGSILGFLAIVFTRFYTVRRHRKKEKNIKKN